ncbi:DUF3325 family protein [Niveispirillum irakense]|uniref:DUF3325 family protein n=1 Tax=Niveispirillum irakense TaxID=34011 RepID=UPI000404E82D|nr:DUF3325 family protein [Niveispirillum irakense]
MMMGLLLVVTVSIATPAFLLLAASQQQHWPLLRLFPLAQPPTGLRLAAWLLLCLSLASTILRDGISFGLVLWVMLLPVAASLVVGFLAIRAGKVRPHTNS